MTKCKQATRPSLDILMTKWRPSDSIRAEPRDQHRGQAGPLACVLRFADFMSRGKASIVPGGGRHLARPIGKDPEIAERTDGVMTRIFSFSTTLALIIALVAIPPTSAQATHNAVDGKVFVIDPGHASTCAGTSGTWTGQQEHDQVWEVAHAAKNYLENLGAIVWLTKNSVSDCPTVQQRADFSNNIGPNAFISIHRNGSEDSSARGIETYYGFSNLSIYVNDALVAEWGWLNRGHQTDCSRVSLPCAVNSPSALAEIGFMTNFDEDVGHDAYADWQKSGLGIANGVYNFCLYNGCD